MGRKEKMSHGLVTHLFTTISLCDTGDMVTAKRPENVKSSYLISNFTDIFDVAKPYWFCMSRVHSYQDQATHEIKHSRL